MPLPSLLVDQNDSANPSSASAVNPSKGLLDFVQSPQGQGLLSAAFGGLATAGRPNTGPLNTIGAAGLAGLNGYSNAQDQALRRTDADLNNQMLGLRINQAKQQASDAEALRNFDFSKYYQTPEQQAMGKYGGPTQAAADAMGKMPGGYDTQGMARAMLNSGQPALIHQGMGILSKASEPVKLGKDEQLMLRGSDGSYTSVASNRVPELKDGFIISDGKGGFTVDPKLYSAALQLKATGAPKVSVSPVIHTGTTFGKKVAEIGGDQLMKLVEAAREAPQMAGDAQQIINALNTKNVIAGPGTSWKITANQIFGGNQDKLNATRQTIQGLAKLSLASRQSLKGQGSITDAEQKMLANAASGDIDNLTTEEIRLIANGAIKNAGYVYGRGKAAASALAKMPELQGILPAFDLPEMPAQSEAAPNSNKSSISAGGWSAVRR